MVLLVCCTCPMCVTHPNASQVSRMRLEGWPATAGRRAKGTWSMGKLALMFSVTLLRWARRNVDRDAVISPQ